MEYWQLILIISQIYLAQGIKDKDVCLCISMLCLGSICALII